MTDVKKDAKPTHFFGSTAFHWCIKETRQEVLTELARWAGAETIKKAIKSSGGLYVWTCEVMAPLDADYQIAYFQPQGVEVERTAEFNLMNTKGWVTPIDKERK